MENKNSYECVYIKLKLKIVDFFCLILARKSDVMTENSEAAKYSCKNACSKFHYCIIPLCKKDFIEQLTEETPSFP